MATFQGVLFLFFGVGLLLVDVRSLRSGWLPFGSKGFGGRLEFRRQEQAVGYWLMFFLYGAAGLWLGLFALRLLTGNAAPLPLR